MPKRHTSRLRRIAIRERVAPPSIEATMMRAIGLPMIVVGLLCIAFAFAS